MTTTSGRATNIYLWPSENVARAFFTDDLRDRVTELYGAEPTIEFVEILELLTTPASERGFSRMEEIIRATRRPTLQLVGRRSG